MAESSEKQLNYTFKEIGATGLPIYSGRIYDEPLRQLSGERWRKTVRDMTANDAVVRSILITVEMMARQVSWNIVPFSDDTEDAENAEFVRECLFEDMTQTWQNTLAEILSMVPWGWSWMEMCFKRRNGRQRNVKKQHLNSRYADGQIGWSKWAIRSQESLYEWKLDEAGEVLAMIQMPEPDFILREIPAVKSLHFRTSSHKNNPEGYSICRGLYRPWYFKSNIENIEGIGVERDLAGLPIAEAPPEYFKSDATPAEKQLLDYLRTLVTGIRRDEQEGIVVPVQYDEKGNKLFSISLLSTGGRRQFDTSGIIDRYDQRMMMSVMADFLLLGSKSVGSYALSTDKTELFCAALSAWLDSICNTVNRHAIPLLLELNGKSTERTPQLTHGTVERQSLAELGEYITKLSGAGIIFDEKQSDYLKRKGDIPVEDSKSA